MAIARRPSRNASTQSSVDVDALINKGGSVGQQETPAEANDSAPAAFTLRVPKPLLERLDTHRKAQLIKVDRQQWILQAIVEKLEREAG